MSTLIKITIEAGGRVIIGDLRTVKQALLSECASIEAYLNRPKDYSALFTQEVIKQASKNHLYLGKKVLKLKVFNELYNAIIFYTEKRTDSISSGISLELNGATLTTFEV